jgi:hypothetical protein
VKIAEFNALCDREWANGRGDVTGLHLTDESFAELSLEALREAESAPLDVMLGAKPAASAVVNPVTRTVVKVQCGSVEDRAEVRRYYAGPHPRGA